MEAVREITDPDLDLFHAIVQQAPDALIFADRDGVIRVWNLAAERMFGYCAAEVVGGSLDVIIPERLRHAHWVGFGAAIATGLTKYGGRVLTTRSVHKDGQKLYVDLSFALMTSPAGAVTGALAIARDCTARHAADSQASGPRVTSVTAMHANALPAASAEPER